MTPPQAQTPHKLSPNARLAVEVGPIVVFLIANAKLGLRWATLPFLIALVIAVLVSWRVERKVPPMTWVALVFALVFGGLTLWLGDTTFIQIKLTVIEVLIGSLLLIGLATGKLFVKSLLGMSIAMDDTGWRKFTLRFALFCFVVAGANEFARRQLDETAWLWFKTAGVMVATIAFMLAQMPLLRRHALPSDDATPPAASS